ncbi:MAG: ATP-binding protein, partial [Candidatus Desantisbacteria bacterium]
TTKEHGYGLGMSIVLGIIQNHGGKIMVKSKPKQGTTFTILLPLKQGEDR